MKYIYRIIKDDDGYRFYLYPGNNHIKAMGKSNSYSTYECCNSKLQVFKASKAVMQNETSRRIDKLSERRFCYTMSYSEEDCFYSNYTFTTRVECCKSMKRVLEHIDAQLQ